MDNETYLAIKKMLDEKTQEIRQLTAKSLDASNKCEKLAALCTEIATDIAKRGDSI